MRRILFLILLTATCHATTWTIRHDGGTRYDASLVPTGQCDGTHDAAYPGTGVNQACSFNDVRYLWWAGVFSNGTPPTWGWVIAGGDTVIIKDCIQYSAPGVPTPGSSGNCRVGYSGPNVGDYFGAIAGDPGGSGMPPIPSGTSGAHTKIYGQNHGTAGAMTELQGGYGVGGIMNLSGSSYVDIDDILLDDHIQCGRVAYPGTGLGCDTSFPLSDYAQNGIYTDNSNHDIFLTNMRIYGMGSNGILGPTGDNFNATDVGVYGNNIAGWNGDLGNNTTFSGHLNLVRFTAEGSGCIGEYPIVHAMPYIGCVDQTHGGYGDGFGTTTVSGTSPTMHISCDQCLFRYNTQDGLDGLHATGAGSTISVTRGTYYGNMGNQIKAGASATMIQNNLINGNMEAMCSPNADPPGFPAGFNTNLGDCGRGGDAAVAVTVDDSYTTLIQGNTLTAASSIGFLIPCADTCTHPAVKYQGNIFIGFVNDSSTGYHPGSGNLSNLFFFDGSVPQGIDVFANAGSAFDHNATLNNKDGCPQTHEANSLCTSPGLTDQTFHLDGIGTLTVASAASSVVGASVAITGLTNDYLGNSRGVPYTMGAYQWLGSPATSGVILGGPIQIQGMLKLQ